MCTYGTPRSAPLRLEDGHSPLSRRLPLKGGVCRALTPCPIPGRVAMIAVCPPGNAGSGTIPRRSQISAAWFGLLAIAADRPAPGPQRYANSRGIRLRAGRPRSLGGCPFGVPRAGEYQLHTLEGESAGPSRSSKTGSALSPTPPRRGESHQVPKGEILCDRGQFPVCCGEDAPGKHHTPVRSQTSPPPGSKAFPADAGGSHNATAEPNSRRRISCAPSRVRTSQPTGEG